MRGPYATSCDEFADCVCTVLDVDNDYTFNHARRKCGVSYNTVRSYATMELYDVNLLINKKCRRAIKPQEITKVHPGFRVFKGLPSNYEPPQSDACTAEPETTPKIPLIPRDLLSKFYPEDMPHRYSSVGRRGSSENLLFPS